MKETVKLGLILFLIAAVAAGVLAATNSVTAPVIAEREANAAMQAYREILPDADDFESVPEAEMKTIREKHPKVLGIIRAKKGGSPYGMLFTTAGGGYGGDIIVITGIEGDAIRAIKILKHKETPMIGTKIEDPSFAERYVGVPATEPVRVVAEKKGPSDVQKITGSTVSSKGVAAAVNAAIACYGEVK